MLRSRSIELARRAHNAPSVAALIGPTTSLGPGRTVELGRRPRIVGRAYPELPETCDCSDAYVDAKACGPVYRSTWAKIIRQKPSENDQAMAAGR